jgi:hypothetical protein
VVLGSSISFFNFRNDSYSQRSLEVSHRIYSYQNDHDIIVRVWPEFSQVGLAMWPAGWYICELILKNQRKNEELIDKRIFQRKENLGIGIR